ncbi:uncharacterized protein LOC134260105 [Saccostrea cucullata]|uniref:uncharacterized protein LOC134260105 n=1 Tax=Saccostrea cuccullata TaxID=36930 RepID=UPI002ED49168
MATPLSWAQEAIMCDLCDMSTEQFCNNCQVNLCAECINKHVKNQKTLTHDIVPLKNKKTHFKLPECKFHSSQRYEAHCQQCDVPVCMKCVIDLHNGHTIRDIPNNFKEKIKEIQKETREIESKMIPRFNKKIEEAVKDKTLAKEKYTDLEKETESQRKVWHQEVDRIFNKFSSLSKSLRDNHLAVQKSHQDKLENSISEMIQTLQRNKELLESLKVSEVSKYQSKMTEHSDIPEAIDVVLRIPSLKACTVEGKEFRIELGEYMVKLSQTSTSSLTDEDSHSSTKALLNKARVIATIPTGVNLLNGLAFLGADKVWISGLGRTIRCFDKQGSLLDTFTTLCQIQPSDISVTIQGDLIYSDYENGTVNTVRDGKTEVLITTPMDWKPAGLTCSRSGDVLVNLYNGDQNKIVRYQGKTIKQEIFKDDNEEEIYGSGNFMLFIAENNNGDICASDRNAKAVVVVDKAGRVRFRYDGSLVKRKEPIDPNQLVTDSMSQIIITDWTNDCLHILNQDGHFLKCLDDCELSRPLGLSVDIEGNLWVGLYEKGDVKVIQYME